MGTFGTGPFSSDGAMDLLEELAGRPPEQRAGALERLFGS
jgi:alpha-glucosidase